MSAFVPAIPLLASSRTPLINTLTPRRAAIFRLAAPRRAAASPSTPRRTSLRMREASDGDVVAVHYTGFLDDGTQFDSSRTRGEPLTFEVGGGNVIPGFDDAVRGLKPGDSRRTRIAVERAYGERTDELVVAIPRSRVPESLQVQEGQRLPLSNGMMATVLGADDTEIRLDANHELAGKALTFDMELVGFEDKVLGPVPDGLERAVFGLGCFWGAELAFQRVPGVVSTKVGYTQGEKENPTYQQVCSGSTGHTEAVAVDFDPKQVSYEEILNVFWERLGGSALTPDQVGNDVGTQYRSGIYWQNAEQRELALASAQKASESLGQDVVVELKSGEEVPFYLAESYHQRYLEKGGQSATKGASEPIRCYG